MKKFVAALWLMIMFVVTMFATFGIGSWRAVVGLLVLGIVYELLT